MSRNWMRNRWIATLAGVVLLAGCGGVDKPAITKIDPASQRVDGVIKVIGENFGLGGQPHVLKIGNKEASTMTWGPGSIDAVVPKDLSGKVQVVVTANGVTGEPAELTITLPPPSISALDPAHAKVGDTITLKGEFFGAKAGKVLMGEAPVADIAKWSDGEIQFKIPAGMEPGAITVQRDSDRSSPMSLDILRPVVTGMEPRGAVAGRQILVKGHDFGTTKEDGKVLFNGVEAQVVKWSDNKIQVIAPQLPPETKKGELKVKALGSESDVRSFPLPAMPASGPLPESGNQSGPDNQILLDPDGFPQIIYFSSAMAAAQLVAWDGFSWSSESWDAPWLKEGSFRKSFGEGVHAVYDAKGVLHATFQLGYDQSVLYAERSKDGKWTMETAMPAPAQRWFQSLAIVLDKDGTPVIARFREKGGVSVIRKGKDGWKEEPIDDGGGEARYYGGAQTSMVIDSKGTIHIAWNSPDAKELRYASNAGGAWKVTTVDDKDVGAFASLALGPGDSLAIAYQDVKNGNLKVARGGPDKWVSQTVDPGPQTGLFNALAIDPKGKFHIAEFDGTANQLKYLTDASGAWKATAPFGKDKGPGKNASIIIPRDGRPMVSCYNEDAKQLSFWRAP